MKRGEVEALSRGVLRYNGRFKGAVGNQKTVAKFAPDSPFFRPFERVVATVWTMLRCVVNHSELLQVGLSRYRLAFLSGILPQSHPDPVVDQRLSSTVGHKHAQERSLAQWMLPWFDDNQDAEEGRGRDRVLDARALEKFVRWTP